MKKVKTGKQMVRLLDLVKLATEDEMVTITKKIAFDSFGDLLLLSPVDTGFFRSNWRIGVNRSDGAKIKGKSHPGRSETNKPVLYQAPYDRPPLIKFGDSVHLFNNTIYGEFLEQGSSEQAPQGMVEQTALRARLQITRLFGALSRRKLDV